MQSLKIRQLYHLCAFTLASFALMGAYGSEYFLNLFPCHLCLLQRWPYAAVLVLSLLGAWFAGAGKRKTSTFCQILSILAFLTSAGIAAYHSAVELHWVEGPSGCTSSGSEGLSNDELMSQIMNAPVVLCDDISFELFGFTMANGNVVYGLFAALFCLVALRKIRRLEKEKAS